MELHEASGEADVQAHSWPLAFRRAALWSMPVATLGGFVATRTWASAPSARATELLLTAGIATTLAIVLRRAGGMHALLALCITWSGALMVYAGPAPVLATVLVFAAATGIGTCFTGTGGVGQRWIALPAGLVVASGVAGWLIAFPVHTAAAYTGVFALVAALRWRAVFSVAAGCARGAARSFDASPRIAAFAVTVIGLVSTAAWVPSVQDDDLNFHLGLVQELQTLGYSRLDVDTSIWAIAPWMGDLIHAFVAVSANTEARGAVNTAWLLLCCAGTWHMTRLLGVPVPLRWLGVAAFASVPLLYSQVAGMQTELPTTAVALALAVALLRRSDPARRIALIAVLAGGMLALKVSNGLLLLPMAAWLLVRVRWGVPSKALMRALLLGFVVGGACYTQAWIFAGNPVLPWLNGVFGSPYFIQDNWMDQRWNAGDWRAPWALMFETSRFVEADPGAMGMLVLVALAGALLALGSARARPVAIVGLGGCVLLFASIQYARYLLPAFAVLWPAALAGLSQLRLQREACVATAGLVLLNAWLLPTSYWSIRDGLLRETIVVGPEAAVAKFAPHRTLAQLLRTRHPGEQVLVVDGKHLAEHAGYAYAVSWFSPTLMHEAASADSDLTGVKWRELLGRREIELVASAAQPSPALRAALAAMSAPRLPEAGAMNLWRIPRPSLPSRVEAGETPDSWPIRAAMPANARRIEVRVTFACDAPETPIETAWSQVSSTSGNARGMHWAWAICGSDGLARIAHTFPPEEGRDEFVIGARPRSAMSVAVQEVRVFAGAERERRDRAAALRRRIAQILGLSPPDAAS